MKHVLNFKPTIIYRKGSSFLLKTILVLIYLIPIFMFTRHYVTYIFHNKINVKYTDAEKKLTDKISAFTTEIEKIKPDSEEAESIENKYYDYKILSSVSRTSLSSLLSHLEKIVSPQIKFTRIGIKPEKLVKIKLEGKTTELAYLTDFLRELYADSVFLNPVIKSHRKQKIYKSEDAYEIAFVLELQYLGESGELP